MTKVLLTILDALYLTYLVIISIVYVLLTPFFILLYLVFKNGKIDDAFRVYNWSYGNLLVKLSWPFIRYEIHGAENIPQDQSMVIVLNHRSSFDIFFSSLVPVSNQLVIVRDWVYRIRLVKWAMKLARYINIDHTSMEAFHKAGKEFSSRKVSFQFYPEGHRSRSGILLRFRTGAFFMASDNDLPVLPVVMTGTENFGSYDFPYLHPAKIDLHILPPVYPDKFEKDLRAQKMRRHVESTYREFLGE